MHVLRLVRAHVSHLIAHACVQVSELLASGRADLSLAEISRAFPFPLDKFQAQAVEILLQGDSVVVSAPTGAGKTVIAEAATVAVLAR
jgi:superfamily II RNA helicase